MQPGLSDGELNELRRWSTGAVCNGWEQIARGPIAGEAINLEPVQDYMPFLGPMAGYAVTVVIQPADEPFFSKWIRGSGICVAMISPVKTIFSAGR